MMVAMTPTLNAGINSQSLRKRNVKTTNSAVDGRIKYSISFDKSATCVVSPVSRYRYVNARILVIGRDTIKAPIIVDCLAISLAATTIIPLNKTLATVTNIDTPQDKPSGL